VPVLRSRMRSLSLFFSLPLIGGVVRQVVVIPCGIAHVAAATRKKYVARPIRQYRLTTRRQIDLPLSGSRFLAWPRRDGRAS
jgi:hypothetical protein